MTWCEVLRTAHRIDPSQANVVAGDKATTASKREIRSFIFTPRFEIKIPLRCCQTQPQSSSFSTIDLTADTAGLP
jgi:hypothetical protein